jgi:tetratricopeptide (TPR) repeat protein
MRTFLLAFSVLIALSFRATAGETEGKATARAHYETATRLYAVGEYERALAEFKSAYVAKDDPAFLFNIGQCHRKLGRIDEAISAYRNFLSHAPVDDPSRPQVEAILRRTQDDAVFREDLEPGEASAPVPTWTDPFEVVASADVAPAFISPPAPRPARLAHRNIDLTERPSPTPRDTSRSLRIAGIVAGSVGVVSIGAAVYFYTRARHYSDVVSNDRNHTPGDVSAGQNAQNLQWVFYGVGAAALAAGAACSWYGWTARPVVVPGFAGASAGGAF